MPGAWRRRAGAVAATLVALAAARPALADVSPSPTTSPPAAPMAFPLGAGPDPIGPGAVVPPRPRCALTWPLPRLVVPLSWVDHHYPTRQADGVVVRYDGVENVNYDGHRGLDLPVAAGTTALAAADGVVVYAGWDDAGGYGVGLEHDGCRTFYFHNSGLLVHVGDAVRRGQVISLTGSTGNSTGPHLHFEVRDLFRHWHSIDPYGWTGAGDDPWPWEQGVLWRGGGPAVVPALPPSVPAAAPWRPDSDLALAPAGDGVVDQVDGALLLASGALTLADGRVVRPPLRGPALRLAGCGGALCVLDLGGDVFRVAGAVSRLVYAPDFNQRGAGLACWASAPACILLDTGGELHPIATEAGAPGPVLDGLPGVWPLDGAPADVRVDPASDPAHPSGALVDDAGRLRRFGGGTMPVAPAR